MPRETARDHLCSRYAAVIAARARTTSRLTPRPSYKLFLAGDLANGVLYVAYGALNPAFGLIGLAFGFGAGIAQRLAGLFLDFVGDLLHATCNTILIHCRPLCMI